MPTKTAIAVNRVEDLIAVSKQFYERRWMWGTAGNLSIRLSNDPLQIAITPSGVNKGEMKTEDILTVEGPRVVSNHPASKPSAETLIHQAIYESVPSANAVLHVHPIFTTILSSRHGHPTEPRLFPVPWIEMMKGVGIGEGITGELAVVPNFQEISLVARDVKNYIQTAKRLIPGVLIYGHGLTAWGRSVDEARNHLEVIDYVCEYLYRNPT